ncbi:MAG: carbon-nitrogen hydrolase family protein [Pontixanthobacter sp.]
MHKIAVLQMNSGVDRHANCTAILSAIADAASGGATMLFTPEMSTYLDQDRRRSAKHVMPENDDPSLRAIQQACAEHGIWVSLGSVPVALENGKFANRAFVIDDGGAIVARYDKMHMFDAELENGESYRESSAYDAGDELIVVDTPIGRLALTICYDIRFPALFAALGKLECDVIATPAAFTQPTGRDHWHVLQRARAIEGSAYCIAAAQTGHHQDGRATYGHSLVVDPWGKIILDMQDQVGVAFAEIDPERIQQVRQQVPSLANRRDFTGMSEL